MATATISRRMSDTYFELIKEFPLTRIRSDVHLAEAQQVIERLLQVRLDKGGQEYLDVLTDEVEIYEDEHHPIPDVSAADVLRELMASNRLTQLQLAKNVKISQSTISAVLHGKRSLTKEQMITLAEFFHVSRTVFSPA
jgi:HTH-type transcriptional regulator / antitoxin HigA